jgi:hypothetical protein
LGGKKVENNLESAEIRATYSALEVWNISGECTVVHHTSYLKLSLVERLLQDSKITGIAGYYSLSILLPKENLELFQIIEELQFRKKDIRMVVKDFLADKIDKKQLLEKLRPYVLASRLGRKEE